MPKVTHQVKWNMPHSLIDDDVPVVVIAPSDKLFEKQPQRARNHLQEGKILLITDERGAKK